MSSRNGLMFSVLLLLGSLLLVGATALTTYLGMLPGGFISRLLPSAQEQGTDVAPRGKPLFKPLDKFVISLEGSKEPHYLVLELALVTHDQEQLELFGELNPAIRNAMVQLFSGYSREQVQRQVQQLDQLQAQVAVKLRKTISGYGLKPELDGVLITKVIIQ